jgi:hypothetical protein
MVIALSEQEIPKETIQNVINQVLKLLDESYQQYTVTSQAKKIEENIESEGSASPMIPPLIDKVSNSWISYRIGGGSFTFSVFDISFGGRNIDSP